MNKELVDIDKVHTEDQIKGGVCIINLPIFMQVSENAPSLAVEPPHQQAKTSQRKLQKSTQHRSRKATEKRGLKTNHKKV